MTINPLDYKIKELNKLKLKKGRLLYAEPFMDDPYFKRSVVLLSEYKTDGAFGFILNKPLDIKVNEVINDITEFDAPVYMGGPVQTDNVFFIHTQGNYIPESIPIGNGLYWSGNFDQLKSMINENQIFPNEIKFFIGYSGWDYDQLNNEVKEESWIISNNNFKGIIELNNENLWQDSLQKMGGQYALFANFPENPSLN